MKKVLSVLLILAAVFGFYGGGISINDILSCKDYWEEEGRKTTEDLNTLEDGLDELSENTEAYLDGLDQVAQGEKDLAAGEKELAAGEADYKAAPKKLADGKAALDALEKSGLQAGIKQFSDGLNAWKNGYPTIKGGQQQIKQAAEAKKFDDVAKAAGKEALVTALINYAGEDAATYQPYVEGMQTTMAAVKANLEGLDGVATFSGAASGVKTALQSAQQTLATSDDPTAVATAKATAKGAVTGNEQINAALSQICGMFDQATGSAYNAVDCYSAIANGNATAQKIGVVLSACENVHPSIQGNIAAIIEGKASIDAWLAGYKQLTDGIPTLADGAQQLSAGIIGNDTLRSTVASAKGGADAIKLLTMLGNNADPGIGVGIITAMKASSLEVFSAKFLPYCVQANTVYQAVNDGIEGKKAEYKQGVKDFKAAPAKLADGRAKLEQGRQDLADGKAKLAEYEDGEQQLRDGLKTLMDTKADGGLTSIAERVGVNEDFSLEDGNFDFEAGYKGLEKGREYQSDSGDLITKELTQRAIGFGTGIGGGVLALVAAILAFMKKNKGAGVIAILAAVAAAAGAFIAKAAGLEFSAIAGSALGATPLVSLGVLAGVALIGAITFFTAPQAE